MASGLELMKRGRDRVAAEVVAEGFPREMGSLGAFAESARVGKAALLTCGFSCTSPMPAFELVNRGRAALSALELVKRRRLGPDERVKGTSGASFASASDGKAVLGAFSSSSSSSVFSGCGGRRVSSYRLKSRDK